MLGVFVPPLGTTAGGVTEAFGVGTDSGILGALAPPTAVSGLIVVGVPILAVAVPGTSPAGGTTGVVVLAGGACAMVVLVGGGVPLPLLSAA